MRKGKVGIIAAGSEKRAIGVGFRRLGLGRLRVLFSKVRVRGIMVISDKIVDNIVIETQIKSNTNYI